MPWLTTAEKGQIKLYCYIMNWRRILIIAAVVGLAGIAYFSRNEVGTALGLIKDANWALLALIPLVQLVSFLCNAMYYRSFLINFKYHVRLSKLYKLSFALNFVNQVLPTGGVAGLTFITYALKEDHVPAGKSTLAQLGRYVLTFISYGIILVAAFLMLYFGGGIDKILVRITVILVIASILVVGGFLYAMYSKTRFNSLVYWVQRVIDWFALKFKRSKKPLIGKARVERALNEFHEGFEMVIRERQRFGVPFIFALAGNIMELSTLYIVFLALGMPINPGAMVISYATANASGAISLIPGDVGVYEATMVAVLTATGVPVAIGLSATILYRIMNKAIFLPVGFYFYSKFLAKNPKAKSAVESVGHHG